MNRLPSEKYQMILTLLRQDISARTIEKLTRVSKVTVCKLAKQNGFQVKRNKGTRDRREYFKVYKMRRTLNQYEQNKLRERIRACLALWLAKVVKPQPASKIYEAIKVQFPHLKKSAVTYILNRDCEGIFHKTAHGYTFQPSQWYCPEAWGPPYRDDKRPAEMISAYALWFQLRGLKDTGMANRLKNIADQKKYNDLARVKLCIPQLRLMAMTAAIGETYEKQTSAA